ncbi:MAG: M18 family aminopeptidase, partial [Clostridiales bacterium]|nr:M18 family aminopeptidase [Clostridiales bacterium]
SEALFHAVCQKAGVPVQHFANRSDLAGGSTLGNISGSHVSVNTLDIGLAQLAMHSSYETAGAKDVDYMIRGMRAFYEADLTAVDDGEYRLN